MNNLKEFPWCWNAVFVKHTFYLLLSSFKLIITGEQGNVNVHYLCRHCVQAVMTFGSIQLKNNCYPTCFHEYSLQQGYFYEICHTSSVNLVLARYSIWPSLFSFVKRFKRQLLCKSFVILKSNEFTCVYNLFEVKKLLN